MTEKKQSAMELIIDLSGFWVTLILATLKQYGIINWSPLWIVCPLWGPFILGVIVLILIPIIGIIISPWK